MIKAILNYTLEEDLFDEANVQMAQKQFSRGVPRATKKALQNLKPTIEMTSWGDLDFESYLNGAHTTAIRVGLLISGDINYAAKAILKQYNPTENFFALSDIVAAAESFRDFKELLLYSFDEKYIRLAGLLGQRVISKSR